jgi:hypothetical protein
MKKSNPLEQIKGRIKSSEHGTIFVASDFADLADNDSARQSLSRLVKSGLIRRILQGVYEYPKFNEFLNETVAPSPHKVALALARNYGWTIVPNGDTALNQLGLSTQVPAEWTYVSDGPYKKYNFDKIIIHFKHTANKDISNLPYKSALMVQAIKAIGKERINNAKIKKMAKLLTDTEKAKILSEGKYITTWVYEILKRICEGAVNK